MTDEMMNLEKPVSKPEIAMGLLMPR